MLEPKVGDVVIHLYEDRWSNGKSEKRFCGISKVKQAARLIREEPPSPGEWAGRGSYYRIELTEFVAFIAPLPVWLFVQEFETEIRRELSEKEPDFFPFTVGGNILRLNQGLYLTKCTRNLYQLLREAMGLQAEDEQPETRALDLRIDYAETKRLAKERYFFARNPELAKAAKQHHGTKCQVCGFDFFVAYGDVGEGYIEAHHVDPLSERPEAQWSQEMMTRVEGVCVLCANCHRMIHRKKPAYSPDDLRKKLKKI